MIETALKIMVSIPIGMSMIMGMVVIVNAGIKAIKEMAQWYNDLK